MNVFSKIFFFLTSFIVFSSCATRNFNQVAFDKAFSKGDYSTCISMLTRRNYGKDSLPLKNMDIATLAHYMKDYRKSQIHFEECERLMLEGDLRSVAQFESFFLNILNSLNYYNQGKIEDALVEIKKADHEKVNQGKVANNSLWYIYSSYETEKDLERIRSFTEDERDSDEYKQTVARFRIPEVAVSEGIPRKPTNNDLYRSSPTAYYLGTIFRKASGDVEGAKLDRDILATLNPNYSWIKQEKGKALLNIVAFSGKIARKKEVVYYFPPEINGIPVYMDEFSIINDEGDVLKIGGLRYKFAYTKAGKNQTRVNRVVAEATNLETGEKVEGVFNLLEDFGEELKKNVALKARKEYNKNKAKSIVGKSLLAVTLMTTATVSQVIADKAENPLAKAIAQATAISALIAYYAGLDKFDKTIKADTRQARFLPARSYVADMNLNEGKYNIKVQYKNDNTFINEEEFTNVEVSSSSLNLLESVCLD